MLTAGARGFLLRRRLRHFRSCALIVQKHWRGYQGRLRFARFRTARNAAIRQVRAVIACAQLSGVLQQRDLIRNKRLCMPDTLSLTRVLSCSPQGLFPFPQPSPARECLRCSPG